MIFFHIILYPTGLIYDFHIFITSSSSFHGFNTNSNSTSWLVSSIGRAPPAPVSYWSRIRIPYKPEFFQAFFFATAKVMCITAMIFFHIISNLGIVKYLKKLLQNNGHEICGLGPKRIQKW